MAFATVQDVAARLGRELTTVEEEQAEYLLEAATAIVAEAAGEDDAWAAALDPVPVLIRVVTTELVVRAMANPGYARSESEQLGQYSHSTSYRDDGAGLWLTDVEELLIRRATGGVTIGSARVDSILGPDAS